MSKTIAQTFVDLFYTSAGRWSDEEDHRGRLNIPTGFMEAWRNRAWRVEYLFGTDSDDPSQIWTFCDGSKVWVDNPWQVCFFTRVRVENDNT